MFLKSVAFFEMGNFSVGYKPTVFLKVRAFYKKVFFLK